jgi:SAM-dependent methyltransferase
MNEEQVRLWNGVSGRAWVDSVGLLDHIFQPFEDLLAGMVRPGAERRVLDVGCGTGAVTRAVARRLGAGGTALGVDLSQPMIDAARARTARDGSRATFVCADVQTHEFEAAAFDLVLSRFGVMFFDDPVQAFTNLRRAASAGAPLLALVWRSPEQNPFMTAAERVAAPLVPGLPARAPGAPGQFAFEDAPRVRRILEQSGWRDVDLRPIDVTCTFAESDLVHYFTRLGPIARVLPGVDEATRAALIAAVRPAFDPYVHDGEVRFTAACWELSARAPHQ